MRALALLCLAWARQDGGAVEFELVVGHPRGRAGPQDTLCHGSDVADEVYIPLQKTTPMLTRTRNQIIKCTEHLNPSNRRNASHPLEM